MVAVQPADAGAGSVPTEHPSHTASAPELVEHATAGERGVGCDHEVRADDRQCEPTIEERRPQLSATHLDQAGLQGDTIDVELGGVRCVSDGIEAEVADVVGGDDGELGRPQVGVHLSGAVDPPVTGVCASQLSIVGDEADHGVPMVETIAEPGVIEHESAPDHVGVEEVQASLEVVASLVRIVGHGRHRCDRAGAGAVEEIEVQAIGMACPPGSFRCGLGGSRWQRASRSARRNRGVGEAGEAFEGIGPQVYRPPLVREELHGSFGTDALPGMANDRTLVCSDEQGTRTPAEFVSSLLSCCHPSPRKTQKCSHHSASS